MGKRKITCNNTTCKHNTMDGGCKKTNITIDTNLACSDFEKGLVYYFSLVWESLENTNMIPINNLNHDLKIGIHFVMRAFHIGFKEVEIGSWRMILLSKDRNGKGLMTDEILAMEMDMDEFEKIVDEFENDRFPQVTQDEAIVESQPFGFLSPTGDFFECDWGEHEKLAQEIIIKKGFKNEWKESEHLLARDYLTIKKGYCIIHNPSMDGGYKVINHKKLTKAQREFLYNYFIDLGDRFKAEMYFQEV